MYVLACMQVRITFKTTDLDWHIIHGLYNIWYRISIIYIHMLLRCCRVMVLRCCRVMGLRCSRVMVLHCCRVMVFPQLRSNPIDAQIHFAQVAIKFTWRPDLLWPSCDQIHWTPKSTLPKLRSDPLDAQIVTYFIMGGRICDSNFATRPTVWSDLLYDQIHLTLCMYMHRSTLVI